ARLSALVYVHCLGWFLGVLVSAVIPVRALVEGLQHVHILGFGDVLAPQNRRGAKRRKRCIRRAQHPL
ncbi:hypothetical protein, partial [Lactococcus petauri]|uniref:hypothetical protein n=1 Tax=Lactococcus petauri TaxID=1940789 RepID=UPI0021F138AB